MAPRRHGGSGRERCPIILVPISAHGDGSCRRVSRDASRLIWKDGGLLDLAWRIKSGHTLDFSQA